jgi:hypothetical protein
MRNRDKVPETREQTIARFDESRYLLFESMLKFGCYTKAHGELFRKIDEQLASIGSHCDKCDHWDICEGCPYTDERGAQQAGLR